MISNNVLLGVTTCNQLEYTKVFIESYNKLENKYDLIFIDDYSTDGTIDYLKNNDFNVVQKKQAAGLTHSWNLLYKYYIDNNYDYLFILNNDVLIPNNSIEPILNLLLNYTVVCPMSTKKGVGHNPIQSIDNYYNNIPFDFTNPNLYQNTQNYILNNTYRKNKIIMTKKFNGFAFAVNKNIINYEYSKNILFNPSNINIAQESDLMYRLLLKRDFPVLSTLSFFYHYKAVTLNNRSFKNYDNRNDLLLYHK